jgi:uncharacterized protein YfiM (DUF2279 family)
MKSLLGVFFFLNSCLISAQDSTSFFAPSHSFNPVRCVGVVSAQGAAYGTSLYYLNKSWYANYVRTPFHVFNDSQEWLQMDKAGHFVAVNYLTKMGIDLMAWSGVPSHQSVFYGSMGGFLFLSGVEVLDAYSAGWGFSWADFTANTLGMGVASFQRAIKYTAVKPGGLDAFGSTSFKYSFHPTAFSSLRSELLGKSFAQQLLKDYNGQTYWASFNVSSFSKRKKAIPTWLNIAVGYGAEGMLGAKDGTVVTDEGMLVLQDRYRQYYLSLDIDLTRIQTKSYFIKTIAQLFSFIKIPAPTLEFSKKGMKAYPFYF